jgi:hypothetical protein
MKAPFSREFTLEVDGRPILAFEAGGNRKAQQIFNESWLLDDLSLLRSGGVSLRTAQSKLSVRPATPEEAAAFGQAAKNDNRRRYAAGLSDRSGRSGKPVMKLIAEHLENAFKFERLRRLPHP